MPMKKMKVALPSGETTLEATASGTMAPEEGPDLPARIEFPDYDTAAARLLDLDGVGLSPAHLCNRSIDEMQPETAGNPALRRPYYKAYHQHLRRIATGLSLSTYVADRDDKHQPTRFQRPTGGRRLRAPRPPTSTAIN